MMCRWPSITIAIYFVIVLFNRVDGETVSIGKLLELQFNYLTDFGRTFSVILREQQQDDLVELFAKVFDGIASDQNIQIQTDFVIIDRNRFDTSFDGCEFVDCVRYASNTRSESKWFAIFSLRENFKGVFADDRYNLRYGVAGSR